MGSEENLSTLHAYVWMYVFICTLHAYVWMCVFICTLHAYVWMCVFIYTCEESMMIPTKYCLKKERGA
jgi:hypothetical protein